ncbi:NADP-dependent phosphogluconate dehydrogenase [Actinoalloteichus hymeniacidonis]|uniref:6-phosphogluconate dehydrogenase, decarboxylating n=1 Tax=Actinoalloteichus hymeniacidonis TaxID=340345 RepID=A0AAC9HRN1_9PSEU|nr:NADP-dependent phosphogluconate dehydrogenase [Actinoalloteichus hymeniacidonis]AOS64369.1 6-phosphogluconate dehydrogenase (decarboxylating) [Actinoalloteichus hymeniacidonis]MBB5907563.1 6-phosphogluconate dehydrogenase [Actinoalloteichus hymeniacidonis]
MTDDVARTARIGVTGLATMGSNLARNLARRGYTVAVHNRTQTKTRELLDQYGDEGTFVEAATLADLVAALERPRQIIVMVKAGAGTDAVLDELAELLEPGDILLDGGNAHFADTRRREAAMREKGLHFVGTGISGGEEGALLGPSIMPGGSSEAYEQVGPVLESIAARVDGEPCCARLGPDGAGHFVKMVHNGIEYADMQLIAETYDLLRRGSGLEPAEIAEVFRTWNEGDLESYLIEITAEVLAHVDPVTGKPFVDVIADRAEQKGTGRWTVREGLELGEPVAGIAEAVFARALSGHVEQRAAAANLPGPAAPPKLGTDFVDDLREALYGAKLAAYAQGFSMITEAGREYGWDIDLGATARIWRGGCIIRARFLNRITDAYKANPELVNLLVDDYFAEQIGRAQEAWRRVVSVAAAAGVPVPGLSSGLAYYDSLRAERLPAALVQGQRDYFGAHTYQRVDRPGSFHTRWSQGRDEVEA